jgi:predicted Fe-Mo cluster-binding NifX family protein
MRVAITADGTDLDSQASPVFGRCPVYCFIDTETMAFEALDNPATAAAAGAGIQAARFVVAHEARAVLTGNVGPNALNVLQSTNVSVYHFAGGTVREAVVEFKAGKLSAIRSATARAHAGMGGAGLGVGRGGGMGRGVGMGRGSGMGRGVGMGRDAAVPATRSAPPASLAGSREEEIAALKDVSGTLRKQLAEVMERLDRLEKGQ